MRDNTERLRPPRFLWVPFELGRPFGAPDAPAFQTRVLRAALALLEREGPPPLLEDFPEDAPGAAADMTGWTCPIPLPVVADTTSPELLRAVRAEIDGLAPWHQVALERRGRSSTGVLGVSIGGIVDFLHGFLDDRSGRPKTGVPSGEAFRQAAELENILSGGGDRQTGSGVEPRACGLVLGRDGGWTAVIGAASGRSCQYGYGRAARRAEPARAAHPKTPSRLGLPVTAKRRYLF